MVHRAPLSCLVLAAALAACGGGAKLSVGQPKVPANITIPDPTAWDGTGPADGTVLFVSRSPKDPSRFIAYEVDPASCTVRRTIEDQIDTLHKLVVGVITDPRENAGTLGIIRNPPPPPPNGQDLVIDAIRLTRPPGMAGQPACTQQGLKVQ